MTRDDAKYQEWLRAYLDMQRQRGLFEVAKAVNGNAIVEHSAKDCSDAVARYEQACRDLY